MYTYFWSWKISNHELDYLIRIIFFFLLMLYATVVAHCRQETTREEKIVSFKFLHGGLYQEKKVLSTKVWWRYTPFWASLMARMAKNPPAMQETLVWSLGQEDPGKGNGNPLQYSCLENSMNRGAWRGYSPWGQTQLKLPSTHTYPFISLSV